MKDIIKILLDKADNETISKYETEDLSIEMDNDNLKFECKSLNKIILMNYDQINQFLSLIQSVNWKNKMTIDEIIEEIDNSLQTAYRELPECLNGLLPCIESIDVYMEKLDGIDTTPYYYNSNLYAESTEILHKYIEFKNKIQYNRYRSISNLNEFDGFREDVGGVIYNLRYALLNSYNLANKYMYKTPELEFMNKHSDIFNYEDKPIGNYIPHSGMSKTMLSELISNCHYVLYRYFNDGDTCMCINDANLIPMSNIILYINDLNIKDRVKLILAIKESIKKFESEYPEFKSSGEYTYGRSQEDYYSNILSSDDPYDDRYDYDTHFTIDDNPLYVISTILMGLMRLAQVDKLWLSEKPVINLRSDETFEKLYDRY